MSRSIRRSVLSFAVTGLTAGSLLVCGLPAASAASVVVKTEEPVQAITPVQSPMDAYLESKGLTRTTPVYITNYTQWAYASNGQVVIDNSQGGSYIRHTLVTTGGEHLLSPGEIKLVSGTPVAGKFVVTKDGAISQRYLNEFNQTERWGTPAENKFHDGSGNYKQRFQTLSEWGTVLRAGEIHYTSFAGGSAKVVEKTMLNIYNKEGGYGVIGFAITDAAETSTTITQTFRTKGGVKTKVVYTKSTGNWTKTRVA